MHRTTEFFLYLAFELSVDTSDHIQPQELFQLLSGDQAAYGRVVGHMFNCLDHRCWCTYAQFTVPGLGAYMLPLDRVVTYVLDSDFDDVTELGEALALDTDVTPHDRRHILQQVEKHAVGSWEQRFTLLAQHVHKNLDFITDSTIFQDEEHAEFASHLFSVLLERWEQVESHRRRLIGYLHTNRDAQSN